jgi:peptidoglycan/xylan/chitin deacetylase (PgdA/CDA1 family)
MYTHGFRFLFLLLASFFLAACGLFCFKGDAGNVSKKSISVHDIRRIDFGSEVAAFGVDSSHGAIVARRQVPILCYHQIRDFRPSDSKRSRDYIVPPALFKEQMKMLADSGYKAVLPDQLIQYLKSGQGMPDKPVMVSFDDADLSQFEVAKPVLDQYGFKAAFFIMTVVLNKPGYMKREHIRHLADEGHVIGSHTWDHMNVRKLTGQDWDIQIDKPSRQLSEITGKPIEYFAYPFGLWDSISASGIRGRGFKAAFQLSAKRDSSQPLYTIRRIIVPGEWSTGRFYQFMKGSFR